MANRPENRTERDYLVSEKGLRQLFVLGGLGSVLIIVIILVLLSAFPKPVYKPLDRSQLEQTVAEAAAKLEAYNVAEDGSVTVPIDRAITLVAERGVSAPFSLAQTTPEAPGGAAITELPDGESLFVSSCAACHQATGQGIPGAFPPLANNVPALFQAEGGRDYLANVLLYGLQGEIEVAGQSYNGVMPAWQQLADEEIAAILNYTLGGWDNAELLPANFADYSAEDIAAKRGQDLNAQQVYEIRQALEIPSLDELPLAVQAAPGEAKPAAFDWQTLGANAYANCAACHQGNGQGIPGAFPPLAGNLAKIYNLEGGREYLINVLLYGLQGQINASGQSYNSVMPAWPQLGEENIAAVLNYGLTSWDNETLLNDFSPILPEGVAAQNGQGLSPQQVLEQRQSLGLE